MANANATPAALIVPVQVLDWTYATVAGGDAVYSLPAEVDAVVVEVPIDVPDQHPHVPWDTWRPRFSPDSQTMLVCRTNPGDHDTDLTSMQLWLFVGAGFDDNEPTMVKGSPSEYGWTSYGHPEWAPDSASIVIAAQSSGFSSIVWLDSASYDTLGVLHEVASPNVANDPSFLPNGDVVFVDFVSGTYYLAIIGNLATPNYTQILSSSNPLADPMINSRGDVLVYSEQVAAPDMSHPLGQWALKTVPVGGGSPTTVLDDGNAHQHPMWMSPRYLLFQTFRYGTDSESQIARIRTNGNDHSVLGAGEYPSPHKV